MEEDDDFYGDGEAAQVEAPKDEKAADGQDEAKDEKMEESLEEGEEEEEEDSSDSDIDIITERNDLVLPEHTHPRAASTNLNRGAAASPGPNRQPAHQPPAKGLPTGPAATSTTPAAPSAPLKPGSSYPEVHTSTIDVNANPTWGPANKPVTALDIDADLAEHDKPWRRPGADQSDYFNYGFDEFTWASYCLRQQSMSAALKDQKAETAKFEMMLAGGMPGMGGPGGPGAPTGPAAQQGGAGMGGMPGMPGMPDEMMQGMMAQMMAQGITDPNQLTFDTFMQMQGMSGGMPGAPQGPAAQQGYGGGQQGQYGGYGGGGHQGGFGGRGGRGGRRW